MGPEPWLLVLWALVVELLGRRLFPNWDVSYALYGARFAMERGGPWMNVWPGMDLLLGQLGRLMGQPEAAITLGLLNVAATLVVWALFRRLGAGRFQGLLAALATGLWTGALAVVSGLSFSAGLTLKLNNSGPGPPARPCCRSGWWPLPRHRGHLWRRAAAADQPLRGHMVHLAGGSWCGRHVATSTAAAAMLLA